MPEETAAPAAPATPAPLAAHVALLVANLEEAVDRWSRATGYTFTPIARYRTSGYRDRSDPQPHFHDARIAISREGPPQIELMEFTGEGTHSARHGEGFHHFGFTLTPDPRGQMDRLRDVGVGHDGESLGPDGDLLLWFTEPSALDGVRLEYVGTGTPPIVRDDGSALPVLPNGMVNMWPAGAADAHAPPSSAPLIHHVGILVEDLAAARDRWAAATGYTFGPIHHYRTDHYADRSDPRPHHHDARVSMTLDGPPSIELMEFTGNGTHSRAEGVGVHHLAFVDYPDLAARMAELAGLGIGDDGRSLTPDGRLLLWFTARNDLNGVRFETVSLGPDPHPIFTESGEWVSLSPGDEP